MMTCFAGDFLVNNQLIKEKGADYAMQVRDAAEKQSAALEALPDDVRLEYGGRKGDDVIQIQRKHPNHTDYYYTFQLVSNEATQLTRREAEKKGFILKKTVRPQESLDAFITRAIEHTKKLVRIAEAEKQLSKPVGKSSGK